MGKKKESLGIIACILLTVIGPIVCAVGVWMWMNPITATDKFFTVVASIIVYLVTLIGCIFVGGVLVLLTKD